MHSYLAAILAFKELAANTIHYTHRSDHVLKEIKLDKYKKILYFTPVLYFEALLLGMSYDILLWTD